MKWMLSVEHFDFREYLLMRLLPESFSQLRLQAAYPTEREKSELCRIANITGQQLNHW
jgi:hypothetical protein